MRWFGLVATIWLAALAAAAPAQSVKAGIDQWSAGRPDQAVAIWRPLAAKGQANAAYNLGQAYKLGRGVPADLAQAQRFYEQAARAGHLEAQTSLGLMLFQGGDKSGALRWLKTAADRGEPRAMLVYGTALFNGDGIKEDRVRAYALVSRAAAQGLSPARSTLEEMDQIIPLEDRRQGVALAQDLLAGQSAPSKRVAKQIAATTAAVPAKPARNIVAPSPTSGAFRVQLGAFKDVASAQRLYAQLGSRLAGAKMTLVPSGTMTRLQVGPYPSRAAASAACAALRPQPCFPVAGR